MFATIRRFWSTLQPITDNDVIQGWIQLDLVGGGGALVPTAELCWSCVPPAHQLLHLNCNCCSQFTYHHVITQITVSHFVFFALSPPLHPLWPGLGGCTPPSISIPDVIYIYKRLFIFSLWGGESGAI